jgi:hypothetical protein
MLACARPATMASGGGGTRRGQRPIISRLTPSVLATARNMKGAATMSCGKSGCGGPCGGPCADRPGDIRCPRMCLYSISKDIKGELRVIDRVSEECGDPRCVTMKVIDFVQAEASSNKNCESDQGRYFNPELKIYDLTHAFVDGDPKRRGFHGGSFRLGGQAGIIDGTISGMTNVNTHRRPFFEGPEPDDCDVPFLMEGRFCGTVQRARDDKLVGAQAIGTYRFRLEEGFDAEKSSIVGTMEGVIVVSCTS